MKNIVKMKALRQFRYADGMTLIWVKSGEEYEVAPSLVDFHVKTGRGEPIPEKKPSKSETGI